MNGCGREEKSEKEKDKVQGVRAAKIIIPCILQL